MALFLNLFSEGRGRAFQETMDLVVLSVVLISEVPGRYYLFSVQI